MTMGKNCGVGAVEKQMLANEIDGIDRRIRGMEETLSNLREKRKAFELIRLAIWDMAYPMKGERR